MTILFHVEAILPQCVTDDFHKFASISLQSFANNRDLSDIALM